MTKFVITGLPRSRTAWFSAYFTQGKTICYHEAAFYGYNMNNPNFHHVGTGESGYVLKPDWVKKLGPHKLVVIRRPIEDVAKGLEKIGVDSNVWLLKSMDTMLDSLGGLHINFNDINERLREIHHYLELPDYDPERAQVFQTMNIQSSHWSK